MIAGVLMLFYPEAEAFWMLSSLITKIIPKDYYSPTMLGVRTDLQVFSSLVKSRLPTLFAHLSAHHVDVAVICVSWFMCLFIEVLPMESALRIWDVLITEQSVAVLFRVGLALLHMHSAHITSIDGQGELFVELTSIPERVLDCDALLATAHSKPCDVSDAEIVKMREPVRKALEKDYLTTIRFLGSGNNAANNSSKKETTSGAK